MTRQISAILFDKDGTLLDFQGTWGAWSADLIRRLAFGNPERVAELARVLAVDLVQARVRPDSVIVAGTPDDIAEQLRGLAWLEDPLATIVDAGHDVRAVPVCELGALLDRLRSLGLKLGVATNDAEGPARQQLRELGVLDRFDFVAGFDSGHGGKPSPGMCLAFADETGIAPDCIAMVGDSLHDLAAGGAAGMVRVGVLTGTADRDTLKAQADVVLDDITALPGWVKGSRDL